MHHLALAEKFNNVVHIGVVGEPKNIVVGHPRLLLCYYHVFATKSSLVKVRKVLIFQGFSVLLALPIFQKFQ